VVLLQASRGLAAAAHRGQEPPQEPAVEPRYDQLTVRGEQEGRAVGAVLQQQASRQHRLPVPDQRTRIRRDDPTWKGSTKYGYALFFMDDASLAYLDKSAGFEIGVGPSVVVVDAGFGRSLSTTTAHSGIYAFIFDQAGLMAGIGIQGSKITRISK
jgi:hypothetical protein